MTETDDLGIPKLDKTGVLPDEATPFENAVPYCPRWEGDDRYGW